MSADRAHYQQVVAKAGDEQLLNMLVGAVLANGFGFYDTDIADCRAEIARRMAQGRSC